MDQQQAEQQTGDSGGSGGVGSLNSTFIKIDGASSKWIYRDVFQYQYVAWPDHGLPVNTKAFLQLVRHVDSHRIDPKMLATSSSSVAGGVGPNAVSAPPLVIHCSAGIGYEIVFDMIYDLMSLIYDFFL